MAITTLTELQTAIADRLARSDFTAAQQNECIAFTESRMQRQLRALDMEIREANLALTGEYVAVPADYLQVRDFYVNGATRTPLKYTSSDALTLHYSDGATGTPQFFTVLGGYFRFGPPPDGANTATLIYYAKFPPLTSTTTTNWILQQHPDAYLYGALMEAAIRTQNPTGAAGYGQLFSEALKSIQSSADRGRWTGPAMATRPG